MDMLTRAGWVALALLHLIPVLPFFAPALVERLYGVPASGEAGVLLVHRGALFLGVLVAALVAAWQPEARRVASVVAAISMVGFLLAYARAGFPTGSLRKIAVADLLGLAPLLFVAWQAWR